jgi:transcriptional regulator of acetoin/glycerol metabolism
MFNMFLQTENISEQRNWFCIEDINSQILAQWKHDAERFLNPESSMMLFRLTQKEAEKNTVDHASLLSIVRIEGQTISSSLTKSHMFLLTDRNGIVIGMKTTNALTQVLENINLGIGTSFSMKHASVNAISVAMHLEHTTVVTGEEHYLQFFYDWICVCAPIRRAGNVIAYLDVSFQKGTELSLIVCLLEKIVHDVERRLEENEPDFIKECLIAKLNEYKMTSRKKRSHTDGFKIKVH